jgi:flavin-dependent dehydrogenase
MVNDYDVAILGGGLAGLTLSLQLKQEKPDIKVLVLEKREDAAPEAAFKVGESSVELGTHYLREVLGLKDYLDSAQLPKHGLRFFFSPKHKNHIHKRVEFGPTYFLPVPSHQIDRGIFENDLVKMSRDLKNDVILDAKVEDVQVRDEIHSVSYKKEGKSTTINTRWVVDATGRASFLKRKLNFTEPSKHKVNATWFRVDHKIDVDTWSNDEKWHSFVKKGLRHLSTIHLMDKGYWVWIIPLIGDRTSVGIVADESIHDFKDYNSLEKSLAWISKNEPQFGKELDGLTDKILDFKLMKHFAHESKETFSTDRWTVVGESGLFSDPFYSPGTDFISIGNTLTSDLIQRDLKGEDIFYRTKFHAQVFRALYDNWMPIYQNQYPLWGSSQIMVAKINWDWAAYWAINCLLFLNDGLTDLKLMKKIVAGPTALMNRYGDISLQMQLLFNDWEPYDKADLSDRYIDPFDLEFMKTLQEDIVEKQVDKTELEKKLMENMELLEFIAAEMYRLVSNEAHGTAMDITVDPYTMSLNNDRTIESPNSKELGRDEHVAKSLLNMWMY